MAVSPPDSPETVTTPPGGGNGAWWLTLAVVSVALLLPLTLTDVPPLLDYPNHLARLFVLSFGGGDPILARFYQPQWAIIPNLALDLVVPPLIRVFPVHDVGRAMAGIVLLLPLFGAIAYHRAITGRLSFGPLAAALVVYNGASLRGFLNFVASLGLALLFAALWAVWRDRAPRRALLAGCAGTVVLFFCHLMGLAFFAILIGGRDLAWLWRQRPRPAVILSRAAFTAAVFALPTMLYALSDLRRMQGAAEFRTLAGKAEAAMLPVINYAWPLDGLTWLILVGAVCVGLTLRWITMRLESALALATLVALFLVTPTGFKGTFDLDTRFIAMAAFLLPAVLEPAELRAGTGRALAGGFTVLFTIRMAVVLTVWHGWAGELADFRAVIAPVRPGDVVLTVGGGSMRLSDGAVVDTHLPALLVIEHRAWWPFLFDNPSQQPIETREPFRALAERLDAAQDPIGLAVVPVTHVLIVGRPPVAVPDGLTRLTGNPTATLFSVRPPPAPPVVR
jgi:hypothetical protein